MPSAPSERYDFYLSFNDSVMAVAREVAQVLTNEGFTVYLRPPVLIDWDHRKTISILETNNKFATMHEAIKNCRDLIILYTKDYEDSNLKDFATFLETHENVERRRIIMLRCDDVPVRGLLAAYPCEDLADIDDLGERRGRILRATGRPVPQPRLREPVTPTVGPDRACNEFLFVCHASEDREVAMNVVRNLEGRGVPCWIAPRDVRPGLPYDDEIAEAIEGCTALLLIFSENCNKRANYIRRELTVAGDFNKLIIPYFVENVQPKKGLSVRLSDLHRINAFQSSEGQAIEEVVKVFSR